VVQLHPVVELELLEAGANGRVFQVGSLAHGLGLPVRHPKTMVEELRVERLHGHVSAPVDGRGQDRSAMLSKVIGEVCPAAEKADPERRLRDHHVRRPKAHRFVKLR
jgi:hypothetical protein